jgi:alkanesulfonate monooxygenase SsuD/methylene tetrahydromethanopterin reductase-like flavin-dependent oxidoreductase (luciferase family)
MISLHLGCTPWRLPIGGRADVLAEQARFAERAGYESFWLPESHFAGAGAIPDPLMLLAAVAAATRTIRLATTSYLLTLRHPLQAAEQVAVLDQLSGGRVILGVGRGYAPALFDAFNVARSEKREIFADCLSLMRDAWAGKPVAPGETRLAPEPVQRPHPPIWVAAFGPKALRQAGALGLPYLASPMESLTTLEANYGRHRAACRAAGLDEPAEVPVMRTVFVSDSMRELEGVRAVLGRQLAEMHTQRGALREAPASVEDFAIVGDAASVRAEIERYRERIGMTHLIATRLRVAGVEPAAFERSLVALAALVGKADLAA